MIRKDVAIVWNKVRQTPRVSVQIQGQPAIVFSERVKLQRIMAQLSGSGRFPAPVVGGD
jgi:hypothetical protein